MLSQTQCRPRSPSLFHLLSSPHGGHECERDSSSSGGVPVKPRVRRVTTGCRDCRHRRVKCPEGAAGADGRKLPCTRCRQAGVECWYPRRTSGARPGEWELASGSGPGSADNVGVIVDHCRRSRGSGAGSRASVSEASPLSIDADVVGVSAEDTLELVRTTPPSGSGPGVATETGGTGIILTAHDSDVVWSPSLLRALFEPNPTAPVFTPSLSGLSSQPAEHTVAAYFETRGCTEIVAAPSNRINWIYTMLFPRLLNLLSSTEVDTPRSAVKSYAHHSFLRLSYVHRANMELDLARRAQLSHEATAQKRLADYSLIQAQVRYVQSSWKTEEYLMAFFIACMADMLDSKPFAIDYVTAFDLQGTTEFDSSLRDMLGVYSTIMAACTPHDPLCSLRLFPGPTASFELAPEGNEWVERFFGVSRPLLLLVGQINRLVLDRRTALRQADAAHLLPGVISQAEDLAAQLSVDRVWSEERQAFGRSARIQRGTEVTRLALLVMTLCELLDVDLSDPRIDAAGRTVMELVNDTEPEEAAGFTWAVSIVAVYITDRELRARMTEALRTAQAWSFGAGYQGAYDIMDMCWRVYDSTGRYPDGIAPWREALAACGRSMYV